MNNAPNISTSRSATSRRTRSYPALSIIRIVFIALAALALLVTMIDILLVFYIDPVGLPQTSAPGYLDPAEQQEWLSRMRDVNASSRETWGKMRVAISLAILLGGLFWTCFLAACAELIKLSLDI